MGVPTQTDQAYRKTIQADIASIAGSLGETLGQKLVAHLAGITDPREVGRWSRGEHVPRHEAEERLRLAYQVFQLLLTEESPHTVRAWFVGLNPQLEDESPVRAIREGHLRDVLVAARAYLAGG